jgi:dipeptidyl aminopeptidase/acylaminoacyl peptidase
MACGRLVGPGVALAAIAATARAQAPSSDIFLAPLSVTASRITLGPLANITHRPGYDNQPSFTPDGRAILFTSTHDDAQSDIYRFDVATKAIARVTATAESEYSATVMPDGKRFSTIRVERDSTQRLWSFALDGSNPTIVVASLKPVGYHAWLDATTLAMFVLGRPNALVIGNLQTGKLDTVARNIGRSLAKLPDTLGFSYAQIGDSGVTMLRGMNPKTHASWDIVRFPRGAQDVVWLRDGRLLAASGTRLLAWKKGDADWRDVADLAAAGFSEGSRLAVSPDEKWIAIVGAMK